MRPASARIAEALASGGIGVCDDFVSSDDVRALRTRAVAAHDAGALRAAAVGSSRAVDGAVRGDRTMWLDLSTAAPAEVAYLAAMEDLRRAVNETLQLGAFDLEAHYAVYAPGAAYARHIDQPRGSGARVVSTVLYLNDGWTPDDGGALRIYLDSCKTRDVPPRAGVLVAFLSERFEHEVLPATRQRWSITAWLRRRAAAL